MKKMDLSVDTLAVESFTTGVTVPPPERGTVEAQMAPCTSPASCRCPTSVIRCATIPATAYSCPVTFDC